MSTTSNSIIIESHSEEETRAVGRRLGERISRGLLIGLTGDLGSGKTRLVQGLAEGLGISRDDVSSPTFVLCHVYEGRLTLLHVDAYRVNSLREFEDLAIEEALEAGHVVVVEWSDRVNAALPAARLQIHLDDLAPDRRRVMVTAHGAEALIVLKTLQSIPH